MIPSLSNVSRTPSFQCSTMAASRKNGQRSPLCNLDQGGGFHQAYRVDRAGGGDVAASSAIFA